MAHTCHILGVVFYTLGISYHVLKLWLLWRDRNKAV
jgi:hypothetical protein